MGLFIANEVKSLYIGDKEVTEVYLGSKKIWSRGYEWIDLGLPSGLLWASTNIGAEKPEDFGLYFAWGETQGYTTEDVNNSVKKFNWTDYELCGGSRITLTKYNTNSSYGIVDNLTTLEQVDDAAYQVDSSCRMPIYDDFEELTANTTSTWETLNGVNGRRFTSKTNGNSIFFPATGLCEDGSVYDVGSAGYLQSSSLVTSIPCYNLNFGFDWRNMGACNFDRCLGFSVRPVKSIN